MWTIGLKLIKLPRWGRARQEYLVLPWLKRKHGQPKRMAGV